MTRGVLACALLLGPASLAAQDTAGGDEPPPISRFGQRRDREWSHATRALERQIPGGPGPGVATIASLVLPGTGQLLLGQRRWPLYAGLDLAAWLVYLDRGRTGRELRREYRELAWTVARVGSPEPRRDGDWEYYERLVSWPRSGAWDTDSERAGVQPETDPSSFNGSVWALARDLYLADGGGEEDPAYARALEFYRKRASPPDFLWDWTGDEADLRRYAELIDWSDEALRLATIVVGAVVANHLFSAVDAFVSSRLSAAETVSVTSNVRARGGGHTLEWQVQLRP